MQIVINVMFVVIVLVAIFFFYQFENAKEEIYNLEEQLDEQKCQYSILKKKTDSEIKQLNAMVANEKKSAENAKESAEKEVKKELYELVFQSQNYDSVENLKNKMKTVLDDLGNH